MGETEELVAAIWSDALDLDRVGHDDDFFELGGNSLIAAVIAARVYRDLGVELELSTLAEAPTVGMMARRIEELRVVRPDDVEVPLSRVSRDQPLPLSYAEERTWETSGTPDSSAAYMMAVPALISGPLEVRAFRRSIDRIVQRHELLRTTFSAQGERPMRVIHPPTPIDLPVIDLRHAPDPKSAARELLQAEARVPLDLARGPLLRMRLARLGDDRYHLLRIHHHIVSDAWSWKVFFDELGALYESYRDGRPPALPEKVPLQYADFAFWERSNLPPGSLRHRESLEWWAKTLQNAPRTMPLPFRRTEPRPSARASEGVVWWGLTPDVSRALDRIARQARATYFMVRLAAFAAQLALDTGTEDLILGTYVTSRRRTATQAMFGLFTNLATLRLDFSGNPTFREWLDRVRVTVVETSARADIPYGPLSQALAEAGTPPPDIRAIFAVSDQPEHRFGSLRITALRRIFSVMPWEFSFTVDRFSEAEDCHAAFDARLHNPEEVRAFIKRFQGLARVVSVDPNRPLGRAAVAPLGRLGRSNI